MPSAVPSTAQPSYTPSFIPSAVPSTAQPSYTPSFIPSDAPSTTPSTTPSTSPTMLPSGYPTYSSSVHVYFIVTHGFSGVSATVYSSNRQYNDAAFKKTVVSMMGFDSNINDVTIEAIADVSMVGRRSLTAAALEMELVYSIHTPTCVFNDTNHATARFMQALNESIQTGSFDTLLQANVGTSDFSSVTTDYVIFGTASPTSSPTSLPTSSPNPYN